MIYGALNHNTHSGGEERTEIYVFLQMYFQLPVPESATVALNTTNSSERVRVRQMLFDEFETFIKVYSFGTEGAFVSIVNFLAHISKPRFCS